MNNHLTTTGARLQFAIQAGVTRLADIRRTLHEDERGLTSTEWALLVAGAAAIAMSLVIVIRQVTQDTANGLETNVNNLNTNSTF